MVGPHVKLKNDSSGLQWLDSDIFVDILVDYKIFKKILRYADRLKDILNSEIF